MMKCLPLVVVLYALLPSCGEADQCKEVLVEYYGGEEEDEPYRSFSAEVKNPPSGRNARPFISEAGKADFANAQFKFLDQNYPPTHVAYKPVLTIVKISGSWSLTGDSFEFLQEVLQSLGEWEAVDTEGSQCTFKADIRVPAHGPLYFVREVLENEYDEAAQETSGVAIIRVIFLTSDTNRFYEHFLDFQHAFIADENELTDENELSEKNTKPKAFGSAADYMFWRGIGQYGGVVKFNALGFQRAVFRAEMTSTPEKIMGDKEEVTCFLTFSGSVTKQLTDSDLCNWHNWKRLAKESLSSGRTAHYDAMNRQVFHVLRGLTVTDKPNGIVTDGDTRRAGKRGRTDGNVNRKKKLRMDHNKKKRQNNDR